MILSDLRMKLRISQEIKLSAQTPPIAPSYSTRIKIQGEHRRSDTQTQSHSWSSHTASSNTGSITNSPLKLGLTHGSHRSSPFTVVTAGNQSCYRRRSRHWSTLNNTEVLIGRSHRRIVGEWKREKVEDKSSSREWERERENWNENNSHIPHTYQQETLDPTAAINDPGELRRG